MTNPAQLPIFTDIEGYEITDSEKSIIKMVSGIVIFSRNLKWQETGELDLEHIQNLCHQIRAINPDITIAIDQEGGAVQRLCNQKDIAESIYNKLPTAAVIGRQHLELKQQGKNIHSPNAKLTMQNITAMGGRRRS